jgi:2-amino-4-ketopentanoate thiolase alpha subunit
MTDDDEPVLAEIEWVVLRPQERAATAPDDTRAVPYLARARGLAADPVVGQEAEIRTANGRRLRGTVLKIYPGYHHSFGRPLPAWVQMQTEIRALARGRSRGDGA